jgi:protein-tyrosine phosphatase
VASAGTAGWEGSGADPSSVAAAAELGIDISDHRARRVDPDEVLDATVVLAMAREHRDEVASALPEAAHKTFTLKELVRLLESLPEKAPGGDAGEVLARRVDAASALRRDYGVVAHWDEAVADPLGQRMGAFRAVASDLQEWCGRLVIGLYGPVPARAGAEGG